jgi:hypothetical protein
MLGILEHMEILMVFLPRCDRSFPNRSPGGKFGKAVLALLEWRFGGDEKSKLQFADPKSPNSLVQQGWYNITSTWLPHYESKSPYFNDTLA